MELLKEMDQFIKKKYPSLNDVIYIKSLVVELKKIFNVDTEINIHNLVRYLTFKGYKNIEEQGEDDFSLDDFFNDLSNEEESITSFNSYRDNKSLFKKITNDSPKDNNIIDQIVKNNQNLVMKIANRYISVSKSLTRDDLINEGNLGLLKAIERFDVSKGYEFSTYATHWIRQSITRAIADKSNIIRIPVHAFEAINKIRNIERKLEFEKPDYSIEDIIMAHGELTVEKYISLKEIEFKFLHDVSLNTTTGEESDGEIIDFITSSTNESFNLLSPSGSNVEEIILQKDLYETLMQEISTLKDKERDIIKYRFGFVDGEVWTLEEIGKIFGVTRERIRQIESKALNKLKNRNLNSNLKEFVEN